ncbi:MAG: hypothetical protein JWO58_36 [Chitinophagaceae bacterium]|nr:hypothetical protein [Chitinophagaceae bacterium]
MKKLYTILFMTLATFSFAQSGDVSVGNLYYNCVGCSNYGYFLGRDWSTTGLAISDGGILSTGQGDAYDGAFELIVSDVLGDTSYTDSLGTGSFISVGNLYMNNAETINGINASVSYFFQPENYIVAAIFKLANPNGTARVVSAKIHSNVGSDNATQLDSASLGGATAVDADRFTISSDGGSNTPSDYSDPVNTFVRQGAGSNIASKAFYLSRPGIYEGKDNNGDDMAEDDIVDSFSVSIPANDYRYIVMFNRLDSMVSSAKNYVIANHFTEAEVLSNGYLGSSFPNAELLKVVNWDFASVITTSITSNVVDLSNSLNAFPNPSSGLVTMNINNSAIGNFTLRIIDNQGSEKQSSSFTKNTPDMNLNLDLTSLSTGLYIVEIKQDNYIARKRISKF